MSDIKKQNEVGFKIKEINDHGHEFEVIIEPPVKEQKSVSFKFGKGKGWKDTKKYVEDGEVKEEPRWLLRIKNTYEERIEAAEADETVDSQMKNYEGKRLQV